MDALGKIDQFISEINCANDLIDLAQALREYTKILGFNKFSFQILKSPHGPRPTFYLTGFPEEWTKRYVSGSYVRHDMIARNAARIIRPFTWLEIGRFDDYTNDQKRVFNEAREFGIISGGSVPVFGADGSKAQLTVTSDCPQHEYDQLFKLHRHELHIIATYTFERLVALKLLNYTPPNFHLTAHELDVLTWTAVGKTRWEISEILNIPENYVKKRLERACRKLNTVNKVQAAITAHVHGLIIL